MAHLKLTAEETTGMQRDLNAILDYVAELNELDTKNVVPLSQVSELAKPMRVRLLRALTHRSRRSLAPR